MGVYVTKSFLPKWEEYEAILKQVWDRGVLTNQGPCVKEFEAKMKEYLGVNFFHYVANGTIALQLALDALNIKSGEIITTPFSYVATVSSILWERCKPVFADIEPNNFTIDPEKIEALITSETKAIMAVHVFGYPCDIDKIRAIADKHKLKVIYDGAHAFGSKYKGKSLLSYGDISTCSFHATKLFHTVEGGACIVKDAEISEKLELSKRFGHNYDAHYQLGINGKCSEFHAAVGLANFPYISEIINERKRLSDLYDSLLDSAVLRPKIVKDLEYNYGYYPAVFKNERELQNIFSLLAEHKIYPRRYFYPSLNVLPYVERQKCPVSEDISLRIACLPLYAGLESKTIETIADKIKIAAES
jgi:dTDP-4-amino-4,6-dideoxygalactose transaminase